MVGVSGSITTVLVMQISRGRGECPDPLFFSSAWASIQSWIHHALVTSAKNPVHLMVASSLKVSTLMRIGIGFSPGCKFDLHQTKSDDRPHHGTLHASYTGALKAAGEMLPEVASLISVLVAYGT